MRDCTLFDAADLLPSAWRSVPGPLRAFNPALLQEGTGWILAYRMVGGDGARRIAACRLDSRLGVVAGSPVALSDAIGFRPGDGYSERTRSWFSDPRLYRIRNRIFIYWNSGWHEPVNHQFLQELDRDFRPVGHPRELVLSGQRRTLEKNWMIFGDDFLHAVYSASPQRILGFSIEGEGKIECSDLSSTAWDNAGYERQFGELRGGAPPQQAGEHYYFIGHSVWGLPEAYRYAAAVYRFSASPPFAPTGAPAGLLELPNPLGATRAYEKLNPAVGEVIYPCGAVHDNGRWLISYGINDERCAIAEIPHAQVEASIKSLSLGRTAEP